MIRCVAWASSVRRFRAVPADGDEVVATGYVSHYEPQGRTQFYVRSLEPVGAGAMELRFRAMCDELRGLGYFDEARKKTLPAFPGRIAVITSSSAAAWQDVVATANQRCKAVGLLLVDVRVQGEGAARQVAAAIRRIDAEHQGLGVDAILVTRGGGSAEDLSAFNERVVADAAFACGLPLVAAIGHESDTTVIDLVADVRAATPTQAVLRLVPSAGQLEEQLRHHERRLALLVRRRLEGERQRLGALARFVLFRDPAALVREARQRLAVLGDRLGRAARHRLDQRPWLGVAAGRLGRAARTNLGWHRERLRTLGLQLESLDPARVLGRGYSYTTTADGRLVRSVEDVRPQDRILTRVGDGAIESTVDRVGEPGAGAAAAPMDLSGPPR